MQWEIARGLAVDFGGKLWLDGGALWGSPPGCAGRWPGLVRCCRRPRARGPIRCATDCASVITAGTALRFPRIGRWWIAALAGLGGIEYVTPIPGRPLA